MPRSVILRDDPAVSGEIRLLREIKPDPGSPGVDWSSPDGPRIRSGAFQLASPERAQACGYPALTMSLFVEAAVVEAHGSVASWASETRPGWGFAVLTAEDLRRESFHLRQDDLEQVENDELPVFHIARRELATGHTVAWLLDDEGAPKVKIPRGAQDRLGAQSRAHGWAVIPTSP